MLLVLCFQSSEAKATSAYFDWTKTHILVDYGDSIDKYKNQFEIHFYVDGKESDDYKIKMATNASTFSTVLTNRVGKYTVYYQAYSENYNIRSEQAIVFEVVDRIPPSVEVKDTNIKINFGEIFDYNKYISVSDNSCKREEISIKLENENSINYAMLGTYHVPVIISDLYDNIVKVNFYVSIFDMISPSIRQIKSPVVQYGQDIKIKDFFVAIDNYDGNITSTIEVNAFDKKRLGYQEIELIVKDMSGNITRSTFNVLVIDETPPELLLKTYILELDIKDYQSFNEEYFKQFLLHVSDNYQLASVEIDLADLKEMVGTYKVLFTAKDNNGNKTEKQLTVNLKEMVGPKIIADAEVSFPVGTNIDYFNLINIADDFDPLAYQKIEIIENKVDINTPGEYSVTYRCANSSAEYTIFNVKVLINEEEHNDELKYIVLIIVVSVAIIAITIIYIRKVKVSRIV